MQRVGISGLLATVMMLTTSPGNASDLRQSDHGVRLFHQVFQLSQGDARIESVERDLRSLDQTAFGGRTSARADETDLGEFLQTLASDASAQNWESLKLDVWVGGEASPAGYFFRYEGRDADGKAVSGEAFITTDRTVVKADVVDHNDLETAHVVEVR